MHSRKDLMYATVTLGTHVVFHVRNLVHFLSRAPEHAHSVCGRSLPRKTYSSHVHVSVGALAAPSLFSCTRSGANESHGGSGLSQSVYKSSVMRSSDFASSDVPSRRRAPTESPPPTTSSERSRALKPDNRRRSRVVETKDADPSRATAIKMRSPHHTRTNLRVIDDRRAFGVLGRARNESLVTRTHATRASSNLDATFPGVIHRSRHPSIRTPRIANVNHVTRPHAR